MTPDGKLSVLVCGLGWWGSKILRNCCRHPGIGRVTGSDPEPSVRAEMARQFGVEVSEDPATSLRDKSLDAAFVITPPKTHHDVVKAALERDLHVVVAKPPTTTVKELESLIAAAAKRKRVFMTDATFCYSPAIGEIRTIMKSGVLGPVRRLESLRFSDNLRVQGGARLEAVMKKAGTDVIRDLALHDLAIISYLFGEGFGVSHVSRSSSLFAGLSDTAHVHLDRSGMDAHVALSWIMPERTRRLTLLGEKGLLVWDDLAQDRKLWRLNYSDAVEQVYALDDKVEPLYQMIDHFLNCIKTGREPNTGPGLMLSAMKLLQEIEAYDHKK